MTFNLHLLRQRAAEIRENLVLLRAVAGDWSAAIDADRRDAALFRLLIVIEAAHAICLHLCTRLPTTPPDSMPECFEKLAASGVCTTELGDSLAKMARFRNLLVHRYWNVDLDLVGQILREHLDDLESFLEALGDYLGDSI